MSDKDITDIERRLNGINIFRRRWRAEEIGTNYAIQYFSKGEHRDEDRWMPLLNTDVANKTPVTDRGTADFIANAPGDIAALLAEVKRLNAHHEAQHA